MSENVSASSTSKQQSTRVGGGSPEDEEEVEEEEEEEPLDDASTSPLLHHSRSERHLSAAEKGNQRLNKIMSEKQNWSALQWVHFFGVIGLSQVGS